MSVLNLASAKPGRARSDYITSPYLTNQCRVTVPFMPPPPFGETASGPSAFVLTNNN